MNLTLWVMLKVVMSSDKVRTSTFGAEPWLIRLLGVVEVLGAIGLILPGVTGIAPLLTPLAAAGLALLMLGALVIHHRRKEFCPGGIPGPLGRHRLGPVRSLLVLNVHPQHATHIVLGASS